MTGLKNYRVQFNQVTRFLDSYQNAANKHAFELAQIEVATTDVEIIRQRLLSLTNFVNDCICSVEVKQQSQDTSTLAVIADPHENQEVWRDLKLSTQQLIHSL
ncbi:hypothetical protein [Paraferrimonas haliotis]|uniref:Uncharacterized protein n=1 Tax=Paraferrimonas haliotis TaxID=2013866 RepID=A0AA37TLA3_9GAMM|nr:hypothetical protein [Paraferrimonas haliotis]GLS83602.1 hypothetical protein GCM10007894_15790 [Paraferrimonas haliotis]